MPSQRISKILEIIDTQSGFEAFRAVGDIEGEIFVALQSAFFSPKPSSEIRVNEQERAVCDIFKECVVPPIPPIIPYKEWGDIADEGLAFLKKFLTGKERNFRNLPEYELIQEKREKRARELEARPEYRDLFREMMGY